MKILPVMLRSLNGLSRQQHPSRMARSISTTKPSLGDANDENKNSNSFETADDFERRIFSGYQDNNPKTDSFYQKLDRLEKRHGNFGASSGMNDGYNYNTQSVDGLDESFSTLSDGMDMKLKKAATSVVYNDEIYEDDYAYRADMTFQRGMTYTTKDLDLTKPGVRKSFKRPEFETTTEEVLRKADFRNVRFLANFLTEAGIIIKRSQTKISATAQRKVAREIKTARAFGLMPFTAMGTKPFVFGRTMEDVDVFRTTMEDLDVDYEFDNYDASNAAPAIVTEANDEPAFDEPISDI
eukprot:TRINITY_DN20876_c0_g1_i1.p1 TRINITY_DN20876_c0_g1~~TRINITY_DN20876_c0_g1_i1.p1  ORF type:complete len:296 (+),score=57.05 TRINITY_DN20876_c0_g1_i1:127-1014(+)